MDFRQSQGRPERPLKKPDGRPAAASTISAAPLPTPQQPRKTAKSVVWAVIATVAILLGFTVWYALSQPSGPRNDRYQVVFLDDNQVFFGKLKNIQGDYFEMEQVYSTQPDASSDSQSSSTVSNDVSIVKVGNLVYGPEDTMMIRADKVKFWQDLKSDSKISKAIDSQQ